MSEPIDIPEDIREAARRIPDEWLHLYGQFAWHSKAEIRGTRAGLRALHDAILKALESGQGEAKVFASDGEGYSIDVVRVNTHAAMGSPEYVMELEYRTGKREIERMKELRLAAGKKAKITAT